MPAQATLPSPPSHDRATRDADNRPPDAGAAAFVAAPLLDHYVISADADPGLMPRVLQLIAKRGLVPAECHAFTRRGNEDGGPARLTMEVKVAGLERIAADHVAACLRQLFGVDSVLHLAERPGVG